MLIALALQGPEAVRHPSAPLGTTHLSRVQSPRGMGGRPSLSVVGTLIVTLADTKLPIGDLLSNCKCLS